LKEIGILEIHFHVKFLHTMMRICKTKNTNVTVFTTKKLFSRIETYLDDKSKYNIVLKEDDESINSFLKRAEKICNEKIDILFVNTIQMSCINLPHYFRLKPKSKMILTIHTANHWLKKKFAFNPKNIFRSTDATISTFLARNFILPKFDAINVVYPPIKDYVQKNTDYKKPVFTLPFNFFDESKTITISRDDNKIRFVVPGLIETFRRDYDLTLNVFEKLFEKYNDKISLCILGKPVGPGGKRIVEKCEKLKQKGFDISFSKGFIPEEEYDKILIENDVIFSPLNVKTKRDTGIEEIYGTTEGSALPFEAIQYAKPLIVPKEFNIINELKSSSITYDNPDDLERVITSIITDSKKLNELKKNALKNSKNFSISRLQKYFEDNILNIK